MISLHENYRQTFSCFRLSIVQILNYLFHSILNFPVLINHRNHKTSESPCHVHINDIVMIILKVCKKYYDNLWLKELTGLSPASSDTEAPLQHL